MGSTPDSQIRPPKVWQLKLWYWLAQPIAVGLVFAVWAAAFGHEDQMYFAIDPRELMAVLVQPVYWMYVLFFSGIITVAQAIYMWPARKPGVTTGRGRSIKLSVTVAGLMVGLGGLALVMGVVGLFDEAFEVTGTMVAESLWLSQLGLLLVLFFVAWILPTLLLLSFCKAGKREDVLGRLANRILLGSAAEAALLIPIDAMIRRRTECYCAEGSFLGLTLLGIVGFVGAGPAVLLPMFASRRRGWYRSHCSACGYDMRGDPAAACCPECGRAWSGSDRSGPGDQAGEPDFVESRQGPGGSNDHESRDHA